MTIRTTGLSGRTTNALDAQRLISGVQRDQLAISRLQQQVSSGQRLIAASDDPVAAIQIFSLKDALATQASFQNNISINQGYLTVTDQSLTTVVDTLNRAKAIAQSGLGSTVSNGDRQTLATEAGALLQSVTNAGNAQYQGRFLFGGSYGTEPPFRLGQTGEVRYSGDQLSIQTFADHDFTVANNVDGQSAFAGFTRPITTRDLNPALALSSKLADLRGGAGITLGSIDVSVSNGGPAITHTVDLTGAETIQDIKTRVENAFASDAITVSVTIDPASQSGLKLTPSAGTISAHDTPGSITATALGIVSTAAASISGSNLDPRLTQFTNLADLNGGTGIGATAGTGLHIVNGARTSVIDLNGAVTVQDVLNRIRAADPDLVADVSPDGRGLNISSRLSGANFSIGEHNGANATNLGIRTFHAGSLISELNHGIGISLDQDPRLTIQRRDGTTAVVDLTGSATVSDVLNRLNAVDPGHLSATLNAVGNGISLTDDSGSGALTVNDNELAKRLGIDGTNTGGASGVLIGRDSHPQQPPGALSILTVLQRALQTGDNQTINRLLPDIDAEIDRVNGVRGAVGARQRLLETVSGQLGDTEITHRESLSQLADTDLSAAISELLQKQQTLQATLQIAARVNQLSVLNYL